MIFIVLGTVARNFRPFTKDPNRPNYDYRHGMKYDMYEMLYNTISIDYLLIKIILLFIYLFMIGYVKVNLTYPIGVTRHGGTETFNLE